MTRWYRLALVVLGLGACISLASVQALKPVTAGAYVFWDLGLTSPYIGLAAALLHSGRKGQQGGRWPVVAMFVSLTGLLLLGDALFWHPDAQGALAVLVVPVFQAGLGVILVALAAFVARRGRRGA